MRSPLLNRQAAWLAGSACAAFWLYYSAGTRGVEGDIWWHLAAGRLLLEGQGPFATDPFSWTAAGRPWVQHEWLGELLAAWLHGVAGFDGLRAAYWLLLATSYALVAAVFVRRGLSVALAGAGALAVHLHLYAQLWPRMQGFTLLGMAATVLLLQQRWSGGRLGHLVWVYPLGVALWANLHAGVIAGPLSCTFALAGELYDRAIDRRRASLGTGGESAAPAGEPAARSGRPALRPFAAMIALSWLALLATPMGWRLPAFIAATVTDPEYRAFYALVAEWGPFRWDYSTCQTFALWGLFLLGCTLAAGMARIPAGIFVLALPWAIVAVASRRHLPLAAIASAPLAAALLQAALARWPELPVWRRRAAGSIATIAALGIVLPPAADRLAGPFETSLRWPSRPALTAALALAPGRRMFNLYDWGGLLIFHGHPAVRVFIDGRQDVYGLELNLTHNRVMGAAAGWHADLARWGVDMVFAPPGAPLVARLRSDPGWRAAFADRSAVVLIKN